MRVRFTKDATKHAGNRRTGVCDKGAAPEQFEAGKTYDLPADQVERWRRRGCLEIGPDGQPLDVAAGGPRGGRAPAGQVAGAAV